MSARADARGLLFAALLALSAAAPADAGAGTAERIVQPAEILREVRVHGNHTTPDADVLALAGLSIGDAVTDDVVLAAEDRLRRSGRFAGVEVRKRLRSIDDPSDILVIVLVDEHAAVSETDLTPGPLKRMRSLGMWLPILDYAEGYGFTYGARVSFVESLGPRSRISVPMTWGGERRIALEADRRFERGPFTRVEGAASVTRRENPHFAIVDTRHEVRVRAERTITPWLRAGGGVRTTNVSFGPAEERHVAPGVDFVIDTRVDPAFPRNAVHLTGGVERLRFPASRHVTRWTTDSHGYVGLIGSSVLALGATTSTVSGPLPAYEQPLLGGTSLLRGYRFGYRAGDNLSTMSAEVRVPLTSPLLMSRFGVKGFIDAGTVYPYGARLSDQAFDAGMGGGVWFTATVIRGGLDIAWPRRGGGPRWHFSMAASF